MVDMDRIRPDDLWYIIGFIATDGNLSGDMRHLNITSKDRSHLFSIRDSLGIDNKIGVKRNGSSLDKKYSVLQFGDVRFYRFLQSVGLTPRKSLTLGALKIDDLYFPDFLRGVIDGDGHITTWIHPSNNHRQWSLGITSASPAFVQWLKEEVETRFGVRGRLHSQKQKNPIYKIKFGKIAAQVILNKIYTKDSLALERKVHKAMECLHDSSRMINYGGVIARVA